MIDLQCPNCHKPLRASPKLIGKRIRCKSCHHVIEVKQPALEDRLEEFFESDAVDAPASVPVPVWSAPAYVPPPRRNDDDINLAQELREQMRDAQRREPPRSREWEQVDSEEVSESTSALDSIPILGWFDFSFNYFAAPVIIRVIWFLVVVGWALGLVGYTVMVAFMLVRTSPTAWLMPGLMYLGSILGSLVGLLVTRVLLEFGIVYFRKTDRSTDAM